MNIILLINSTHAGEYGMELAEIPDKIRDYFSDLEGGEEE